MEWFYCFVLVKVGTLISTIILRSFLLTGICGLLQVGGGEQPEVKHQGVYLPNGTETTLGCCS